MKLKRKFFLLLYSLIFIVNIMYKGYCFEDSNFKGSNGIITVKKIEGKSAIFNNDIPTAQYKAIIDAKINAITYVVGTYVEAETMVKNGMFLNDFIKTNSLGYVRKYNILKEWQEENLYYVEINAEVEKEPLTSSTYQQKLCDEVCREDSVIVVVPEYIQGQEQNISTVQEEINKSLFDNGFKILDVKTLANLKNEKEECIKDSTCIFDLGLKYLSKYLVIGEAKATKSSIDESTNNLFVRAYTNLKAVKTTNGEIIYPSAEICIKGIKKIFGEESDLINIISKDAFYTAAGIITGTKNERGWSYLCDSSSTTTSSLVEEIAKDIKKTKHKITIIVSGLEDKTEAEKFYSLLSLSIRWAEAIELKSYEKENSVFTLTYATKTKYLAEDIQQLKVENFLYDIKILSFSDEEIKVECIKKGG